MPTTTARQVTHVLAAMALAGLALVAGADGPRTTLWEQSYDGGVGDDIGYAVTIDSAGNVLTAGYVREDLQGTSATGTNGFVRKWSRAGAVLWTQVLDNAATDLVASASGDSYLAVEVDAADNVVLGGAYSGDWGGGDGYHNVAYVRKLDPDGNLLWEWKGDGSYGAWSAVRGIDVGHDGSVYACGNTFTSWGPIQHEWAIWKFSPDGVLQPGFPLKHNVSAVHEISDIAYGIDVRPDGSFLVVGTIGITWAGSTATKDMDWHVRCYGADAGFRWADTYSGAANLNDTAFGATHDSQGHWYVAGYANEGTDNSDGQDYEGILIKYGPDGQREETVVSDGPAGTQVLFRDLVLDDGGVLDVVGYARAAGSDVNEGLTEARDPNDLSLFGDDTYGDDTNLLALSVAARDDLIAVAGYFGDSGTTDLFTMLGQFEEENAAPVFDETPASPTDLAAIGESLPFAVVAHDPDEDQLSVAWDFGDGTFGSGPAAAHAYSAPGLHRVRVTLSDGIENVEQEFDVRVGEPMELPKLRAQLNFKKSPRDRVVLKARLDLPEEFAVRDAAMNVDVGGVPHDFVFDKKGKAKTATGKAVLKYKKKKRLWYLTVTLKKGDWAVDWRSSGLVDETVKKVPVTLKCTVTLGDWRCAHLVDALYTAKAGKWGKTK